MSPDLTPNVMDRLIAIAWPGWALARMQARAQIATLRFYDASAHGRRTSGWRHPGGDANAPAGRDLETLRRLSRDLRRNNSWARNGIELIAANTVGWGIEARVEEHEHAEDAREIWQQWSENTASDYDRRMPFTGVQDLVMQAVVESGECLVLRERARVSDGLPVPLRVRILEADHLDHGKHDVAGPTGNPIVRGVEFDGAGRRVAYWLFPEHPGAGVRSAFSSVRVSASDTLHIYRVDRPGQVRGFPWLTTAIERLHDLDSYDQAVLLQQKIAACMAAFVSDEGTSRNALNDQDPDDDELEEIEPGTIQYLPAGRTITFSQPPQAQKADFAAGHLRQIAAGLGMPYEQLTGDYTKATFSSARMGRLSHQRNLHKWRWHMLIPQLCDGVFGWVMDLAAELRGWTSTPTAEWSPPPLPMLEPDKEGLALNRLVRGGFLTWDQAVRELGEKPDTQRAEIEAHTKALAGAGIILDSDPNTTNNSGQKQAV